MCARSARNHFRIGAAERLRMLFDGDYAEYDTNLQSTDPLKFATPSPIASGSMPPSRPPG